MKNNLIYANKMLQYSYHLKKSLICIVIKQIYPVPVFLATGQPSTFICADSQLRCSSNFHQHQLPVSIFGVFTVVYGIPETRTHYSSLKTAARLSTYPERSCTLHHSAAIVIKYLGMVRDVSSFLSFINTIIYFLCVDFSHIVGLWSILIGIMWSEGQKIHRTQVIRLCRFLCA